MPISLQQKHWSAQARRACTPTEVVTRLAGLAGWQLTGNDNKVAIEKAFEFQNFHDTMAFVNAVAFVAHAQDHHPELSVSYSRCVIRFNTHDVGGISVTDFECAAHVDALLGKQPD